MAHHKSLVPKVLVFIFLGILAATESRNLPCCKFPAIYNFGDSNSDTRSTASAKSGHYTLSDGLLIVDFIAKKLEKPYLSAYEGKIATDFSHGANFAVGGSTIVYRNDSMFPFLGDQLAQFAKFKAQIIPFLKTASTKDFSRALYTIDIGQNDVTRSMYGANIQEIPNMIHQLAVAVKNLYDDGARIFWIHNTGPTGCLSALQKTRSAFMSGDLDEFGCLKSYNDVAKEFNKQLRNKVVELRAELKEVAITYVDVYTAKYKLFSNAKNLGFTNPFGICKTENVTCPDPSKYLLWDGVHYTEAANRLVAAAILDGSLSDPPLAITHACYIDVTM